MSQNAVSAYAVFEDEPGKFAVETRKQETDGRTPVLILDLTRVEAGFLRTTPLQALLQSRFSSVKPGWVNVFFDTVLRDLAADTPMASLIGKVRAPGRPSAPSRSASAHELCSYAVRRLDSGALSVEPLMEGDAAQDALVIPGLTRSEASILRTPPLQALLASRLPVHAADVCGTTLFLSHLERDLRPGSPMSALISKARHARRGTIIPVSGQEADVPCLRIRNDAIVPESA